MVRDGVTRAHNIDDRTHQAILLKLLTDQDVGTIIRRSLEGVRWLREMLLFLFIFIIN